MPTGSPLPSNHPCRRPRATVAPPQRANVNIPQRARRAPPSNVSWPSQNQRGSVSPNPQRARRLQESSRMFPQVGVWGPDPKRGVQKSPAKNGRDWACTELHEPCGAHRSRCGGGFHAAERSQETLLSQRRALAGSGGRMRRKTSVPAWLPHWNSTEGPLPSRARIGGPASLRAPAVRRIARLVCGHPPCGGLPGPPALRRIARPFRDAPRCAEERRGVHVAG